MAYRPVVLCILDGWGLRDDDGKEGNAPLLARTPHFDRIWQSCPSARLHASGEDVGLPPGQMGNSEVGHTNIGAGRVVWMDLPRINRAIDDKSLQANAQLGDFIAALRKSGGTAHLCGLLSPGGVHSHLEHLGALALILAEAGVPVAVHAYLDGRDVGPFTARAALRDFDQICAQQPLIRIATMIGRFYAMDRDNRWDRVEKAFRLCTQAQGQRFDEPAQAVDAAYERGESDEFITPCVIGDYTGMKDGDGLICANFRADRVREILGALVDPDFAEFPVSGRPEFAAQIGLVEYSEKLAQWMPAIFAPANIVNTLGAWVSSKGCRQFRLAETEKYPHVTFFFNGGIETPNPGENRIMAPSPKVRTYDLQPEMAAPEVCQHLCTAIEADYDLIIVNFANPDMVGHTGKIDAAIQACEAVDTALGRALDVLAAKGGAMLVTADHGNCETMIDADGGAHTAHTTNLVPVVLVAHPDGAHRLVDGRLADIAPTLLELMGLDQPPEMDGCSLLRPQM